MNNNMVNMPEFVPLPTTHSTTSYNVDHHSRMWHVVNTRRVCSFVFASALFFLLLAHVGAQTQTQTQTSTSWGYRFRAGQHVVVAKSMSMHIRGHEQNVSIEEEFSVEVDSVNNDGDLYLTVKGASDSKNPDIEVLRAATGTMNGPTVLADGSVAHIRMSRTGTMLQGRFGFPPELILKITKLNPREKRLDSLQRALVRAKEQRLLQALANDLFLALPAVTQRVEGTTWYVLPGACETLESFVRDTSNTHSNTLSHADSSRATKYTVAQTTYYGKDACYLVTGRPRDPLARNSVMDDGCMMPQHDDLSVRKSDGLILYREVSLSGVSAIAGPFTSTIRYTVRM